MVPVVTLGAVAWCVAGTKLGFLGGDYNLYWLDTSERKEFSKLDIKEGAIVWIYVAQEVRKIISVIPYNGEKQEDLIGVDPVEVTI